MKALLIGASVIALAAAPARAADDTACKALAAQLRALPAAPYDASSDLIEGPVERLADIRASGVTLDKTAALTADQVEGLDATLKSRFHASAAVLKAVDDLDPADANEAWLHRLGGSDVYAVETEAGTMDCQAFAFFVARPGGTTATVPAPKQAIGIGDNGMSFCTTAEGLPGSVGATPVFIEEGWDSVAPAYDIDIAAWLGHGWARPCALHAVFRSSYRVAKIDCRGEVCAGLPAAALDMAQRRQAQIVAHGAAQDAPNTFAWGPATPAAAKADLGKLTDLLADPPTLDASSITGDTEHGFGDDAVVFPVVLAGRTYAVVLSHGGVGWRIYPDFVLALYDLKAGAAERVASVYIVREVGSVQSIKLTP